MKIYLSLFVFLLSALAPSLLSAQAVKGQKALGAFNGWRTYTYNEKGNTVCYMVLAAPALQKSKIKRGPAYLMITHRPAEYTKDVISYTAGFNYKPASEAEVKFGKLNFSLFTSKDTAWSHDAKTDHDIAAAIKNGTVMTISGTPQSGAKTANVITDTLDLKGSAQAYGAIGKACGYGSDSAKPTKPTKSVKPKTTLNGSPATISH